MISREYHLEDSPWIRMDLNWDPLTQGIRAKHYEKGHVFYVEEESCPNVFIVKQGRVALHINSSDGRMKTVLTLDKGSIFGNLSLFDARANACGATLVSDTGEVYTVPKAIVLEKMETDPSIASNIMLENTRIIRVMIRQLELVSFEGSKAIVCFYLLHLAHQYLDENRRDDGQTHIRMRFTHQDIADVTGLSRVSVSHVMSDLVKEHILEKKQGYYSIMNLKELETLALK